MGIWLSGFLSVFVLFQLVAVPALLQRRNDFADVAWAPGFALGGWGAALYGVFGGLRALDLRALVLLVLVTVWAARLFGAMAVRNLSKREEDVRYANWRKAWGPTQAWRSYLQVWVLQPLILYVILLPVLLCLAGPARPLGPVAFAGILFWLTGFLFETIADEQLRRHKANPGNRGQLMTSGLWSLSRHPNYFGETLVWWGVWLLTAELPGSLWVLVSPLGLTYLLLRVSGVSMTEDLMKARAGYQEYARRTSPFLPWPPKSGS